jgi:hypothetical protein
MRSKNYCSAPDAEQSAYLKHLTSSCAGEARRGPRLARPDINNRPPPKKDLPRPTTLPGVPGGQGQPQPRKHEAGPQLGAPKVVDRYPANMGGPQHQKAAGVLAFQHRLDGTCRCVAGALSLRGMPGCSRKVLTWRDSVPVFSSTRLSWG